MSKRLSMPHLLTALPLYLPGEDRGNTGGTTSALACPSWRGTSGPRPRHRDEASLVLPGHLVELLARDPGGQPIFRRIEGPEE